jgi:hypothetical protein
MTDRELLEKAAKAAGLDVVDARTYDLLVFDGPKHIKGWDPLRNDGDALRLAVKLKFDLYRYDAPIIPAEIAHVDVVHFNRAIGGVSEVTIEDPYAATRRAIVRAAAAMHDAGASA